jgi:hypothetical protein
MSVTKISLVQWLVNNLNVILYLSTWHTVYVSVLTPFMITPYLIVNPYVSLMYELKKIENLFTSKFVGTEPSSYKKRIYWAAVSQNLRNIALIKPGCWMWTLLFCSAPHLSLTINFSSRIVQSADFFLFLHVRYLLLSIKIDIMWTWYIWS